MRPGIDASGCGVTAADERGDALALLPALIDNPHLVRRHRMSSLRDRPLLVAQIVDLRAR